MTKIFGEFAEFYESEFFAEGFDRRAIPLIRSILIVRKLHPRTCLDLGCGNGVASTLLAKEGLQVIGLDQSKEMLAIARRRAKKALLNIEFVKGEIRNFRLKQKVDLVVSLFDVLNYLTNVRDIESCFAKVHDSMSDKGLFIFDMHSRGEMNAKNKSNYNHFFQDVNTATVSSFDSKTGLIQSNIIMFLKVQDGHFEKTVETHIQRVYGKKMIREALKKTGFIRIAVSESLQIGGRLLGIASK